MSGRTVRALVYAADTDEGGWGCAHRGARTRTRTRNGPWRPRQRVPPHGRPRRDRALGRGGGCCIWLVLVLLR
jgi:hypothetical protein